MDMDARLIAEIMDGFVSLCVSNMIFLFFIWFRSQREDVDIFRLTELPVWLMCVAVINLFCLTHRLLAYLVQFL